MSEWRKIEGFPRYSVSNEGQVRNDTKGKILKAYVDSYYNRYVHYTLYHAGTRKHFKGHKLVALAFLENPENYLQINHKDGNKENNKVENLEWCSASQNVQHAYRTGLQPPYRGFKLKVPQVMRFSSFMPVAQISKATGVSQDVVRWIIKKETKRVQSSHKPLFKNELIKKEKQSCQNVQ